MNTHNCKRLIFQILLGQICMVLLCRKKLYIYTYIFKKNSFFMRINVANFIQLQRSWSKWCKSVRGIKEKPGHLYSSYTDMTTLCPIKFVGWRGSIQLIVSIHKWQCAVLLTLSWPFTLLIYVVWYQYRALDCYQSWGPK